MSLKRFFRRLIRFLFLILLFILFIFGLVFLVGTLSLWLGWCGGGSEFVSFECIGPPLVSSSLGFIAALHFMIIALFFAYRVELFVIIGFVLGVFFFARIPTFLQKK